MNEPLPSMLMMVPKSSACFLVAHAEQVSISNRCMNLKSYKNSNIFSALVRPNFVLFGGFIEKLLGANVLFYSCRNNTLFKTFISNKVFYWAILLVLLFSASRDLPAGDVILTNKLLNQQISRLGWKMCFNFNSKTKLLGKPYLN